MFPETLIHVSMAWLSRVSSALLPKSGSFLTELCSKQVPNAAARGILPIPALPLVSQVRTQYIDWRMVRDVKRRRLVKEHAPERLRINALRMNTILPTEIQEIADAEIHAFPRDACRERVVNRCVLTSRPRSVLQRWRLSRIMFRHLADYNKLSGVTRATW